MTTAAGERLVNTLERLAAQTRRPPAPAAVPVRGVPHKADIAQQLVSLLATDSYESDQYRTLRHIVEQLRQESGLKVLAVTSPGPGEGKTTTALNLAGALAQSPHARVLVVDADLRRPSVSEYLGLDRLQGPGLVDALADPACDMRRAIRRLDGFSLSVLPAGLPHPSPYELLNSRRFEELLRESGELYDYVVVDTPPLVPLPDCRLVGKSVDGFLVVVCAHKTRRGILAEALQSLDPAKVIGIVFNGDHRPNGGYSGYYQYYRAAGDRQSGRWREWLTRRRFSGPVLASRSSAKRAL
jgi:capsular exopolysaccharide synthesis family protein